MTGQSIVWEMQGGARAAAHVISGLNPAMSLATVTDFDIDGDEDLMFRDVTAGDGSDGDTIIWRMSSGSGMWRVAVYCARSKGIRMV